MDVGCAVDGDLADADIWEGWLRVRSGESGESGGEGSRPTVDIEDGVLGAWLELARSVAQISDSWTR